MFAPEIDEAQGSASRTTTRSWAHEMDRFAVLASNARCRCALLCRSELSRYFSGGQPPPLGSTCASFASRAIRAADAHVELSLKGSRTLSTSNSV